MMGRVSVIPALTALGFALSVPSVAAQSSPQAVRVPWNTGIGHGPDGPWNYIKLNIGNPSSSVDFYPFFGVPQSDVIRSDACSQATCLDPVPSYYDVSASSAQNSDQSIATKQSPLGGDLHTIQGWNGTDYWWTDSVSYGDSNTGGSDMVLSVFPNATASHGSKSWVPVSLLSLEPNANSNPVQTTSGGNATQNTLLELYTSSTGGAPTVAMHMGVSGYNQTGSLTFGGYDQNRLIEPPAIFNRLGAVPLQSLSFGYSSGDSPWQGVSNAPPNNFLSDGKAQNVLLSPHIPTFQLPPPVCNVLAQHLPITFDQQTALYLWNTSDAMYTKLVTSPAYLNFTFGDTAKTSIRVPFAALSLNLTQPVKDTPTPYFPCDQRANGANLGRAFLQSAFLLQSYDPHPAIYVGQAPGPGGSQQDGNLVNLAASNPNDQPGSNPPKWEDTWKGILAPLGSKSTSSSQGNSSAQSDTGAGNGTGGSTGLSSGAIAGIVIAVIFVIVVMIGILAFFIKKNRIAARNTAEQQRQQMSQDQAAAEAQYHAHKADWKGATGTGQMPYLQAAEMSTAPPVHEIDSGVRWHEIDSSVDRTPHEMADTSQRVELGSATRH